MYAAAGVCNLEEVERLLQSGADPLGSAEEHYPNDHIPGELFGDASCDEKLATVLPQMLELFYAYGMDIESRKIPAGDGDNINPLWDLAFCQDENGLQILETMLAHRLDIQSTEELVSHIFYRYGNV